MKHTMTIEFESRIPMCDRYREIETSVETLLRHLDSTTPTIGQGYPAVVTSIHIKNEYGLGLGIFHGTAKIKALTDERNAE